MCFFRQLKKFPELSEELWEESGPRNSIPFRYAFNTEQSCLDGKVIKSVVKEKMGLLKKCIIKMVNYSLLKTLFSYYCSLHNYEKILIIYNFTTITKTENFDFTDVLTVTNDRSNKTYKK